jgi:hypothetical protein
LTRQIAVEAWLNKWGNDYPLTETPKGGDGNGRFRSGQFNTNLSAVTPNNPVVVLLQPSQNRRHLFRPA